MRYVFRREVHAIIVRQDEVEVGEGTPQEIEAAREAWERSLRDAHAVVIDHASGIAVGTLVYDREKQTPVFASQSELPEWALAHKAQPRAPWANLVEHSLIGGDGLGVHSTEATPDLAGDDDGGDPFDVDAGDVVVNAQRQVRIVCQSYTGRVVWLEPATGQVYDDSLDTWGRWAGYCLWFIRDDGEGWRFRSPFDEKHQTNDPKPSEGGA